MIAQNGDRIIVEGTQLGPPRRTGVVMAVTHADGGPPCEIRWLDDGRTTLLHPGPGARIEHHDHSSTSRCTVTPMTVVAVADRNHPDLDAVNARTADGGIVTIRAVRPSDRGGLTRLYGGATPESLRFRFFEQPSAATVAAEVDQLCRPGTNHQSVLAVDGADLVGVASWERTGDTGHRAEFSVFVEEDHRGRGIGTLLLEHLTARARRRGVSELIGRVLWDNVAMRRVARDLSSHVSSRLTLGVVEVRLAAGGTAAAVPSMHTPGLSCG
jgi:GNAT superfamily N-acetyltransferase